MKNLNIPKEIEKDFTKNQALTTITAQFEKYLSDKQIQGKATDLNEFIFAHIPDLDLSIEIDRNQSLPDSAFFVHRCGVGSKGKSGENAVVYSAIVGSDAPPFSFNAIYLHDKLTPNSCSMIIHQEVETKQLGMTTTKSMLMQFDGAPESAHITVDAGTWQIDITDKIKEIVREMFNARDDERFPIGHKLITENRNNPATYGYLGEWTLEESDITLRSCTDNAYLGKTNGVNMPVAPVPLHSHRGTFKGAELPPHSHGFQKGLWKLDVNGSGSQFLNDAELYYQEFSTEYVTAGIPVGTIEIKGTGTNNARIDVRGRHKLVFIFTRTA